MPSFKTSVTNKCRHPSHQIRLRSNVARMYAVIMTSHRQTSVQCSWDDSRRIHSTCSSVHLGLHGTRVKLRMVTGSVKIRYGLRGRLLLSSILQDCVACVIRSLRRRLNWHGRLSYTRKMKNSNLHLCCQVRLIIHIKYFF